MKTLEWDKRSSAVTLTSKIDSSRVVSDRDIEEFRFPEPAVTRAPVTRTSSLVTLVALHGDQLPVCFKYGR